MSASRANKIRAGRDRFASSTSETLTQRTALRDVLFYFILFLHSQA
jgi:hypothetical protein